MRKTKLTMLFTSILLLLSACSYSTNTETDTFNQQVEVIQSEQEVTQETTDLSGLEVHFIDVGQGDSILIKEGKDAMLVDAGGNDKGTTVQKYLSKKDVSELTYVIGTHPHEDHIGGLDVILYKFNTDLVLLPDYVLDTKTCEEMYQVINDKGYECELPANGDEYSLGDATFTIISDDSYTGDNPNNYSIGIRLVYGETSFVLCGDMEEDSELNVIQNGDVLDADVLKASHHGSSTSTCDEFLDAVSPDTVVISCGKDNSYGHPHDRILEDCAERDIEILRTDLNGSIVAYSDGETITWSTEKEDTEVTIDSEESTEETETTGTEQEYVLNTHTGKIHKPDCESVSKMSDYIDTPHD